MCVRARGGHSLVISVLVFFFFLSLITLYLVYVLISELTVLGRLTSWLALVFLHFCLPVPTWLFYGF